MKPQTNPSTNTPLVKYLDNPLNATFIVQHAKVAQKSYGNEKRFFCPPPCIYFSGNGWKRKEEENEKKSKNNEEGNLIARGQASNHICSFMSINSIGKDSVHMTFETDNFCAAKTLYISDSDKSKYFTLSTSLFYSNGEAIGTFHGHHIKVISKPSKKKQSLKNADLCIESGSKVAFFNRLRSQTVSTRYLNVQDGEFQASSIHWGAFEINLVSNSTEESDEFSVEPGFIHYGATIKLVCSVSNIALPLMVIHKVDKQSVMLDAEEPVSQLHKCALRFKHGAQHGDQNSRSYLSLSQDKIVQFHTTRSGDREVVSDGASWTVISTEALKYTFCDVYTTSVLPVSPVPLVKHVNINGSGSSTMVVLLGDNFTPNIKICFACVEAETSFRCEESIMCRVPEKWRIPDEYLKRVGTDHYEVSLILLRSDGVIYPTEFVYTYTNNTTNHHTTPIMPPIHYQACPLVPKPF